MESELIKSLKSYLENTPIEEVKKKWAEVENMFEDALHKEESKEVELRGITYDYIINLTKFFLVKYKEGEIKSFDQLLRCVKAKVPEILNFSFKFDEEIWNPDTPEHYKALIEFKVQLKGLVEFLPFRLFLNKGFEQRAIMLIPGTATWEQT